MSKLQVTHVSSITFVKNIETGEWGMRHHPDYIRTYEDLTRRDLEDAAHDLANAAKVERYAGHAVGCTLDRVTGGVCLVGAIETATYKEIFVNDVGEFFDFTTEEWVESGVHRADAAILVLAYILPTNLCEGCPADRHGTATYPFAKITHFNDMHCTGVQQATRLLDLASTVADYRSSHVALRTMRQTPLPRQSSETAETVVV